MKTVLYGISALLIVFVALPIWFYLLYKILVAVNANELMWFLYWIYAPVTILSLAVSRLTTKE